MLGTRCVLARKRGIALRSHGNGTKIRDGHAQCTPTNAPAEVRMDLNVLGSLYLGAHRASVFAGANRLHSNDSAVIQRLDAAFLSDVPAELGYGF